MDDNYFDKKIKKILESPPEFEPQAADIKAMQQLIRAEQSGDQKKRNWWPWLLLLLLLLSLGGGGYLYQKYSATNQQLLLLTQRIDEIESAQTHIHTQKTVYQYDTIYKVVYEYIYLNTPEPQHTAPQYYNPLLSAYPASSLPSFPGGSNSRISFLLGISDFPVGTGLQMARPHYSLHTDDPIQNLKEGESLPRISTVDINTILPPVQSLPLSPLHLKKLTDLPIKANEAYREVPLNKKKNITYFIPDGWRFGLGGAPLTNWSNGLFQSAYSLGVNVGITFPQNRSLNVGAEYLSSKFEIKDPALYNDYPILPPYAVGDVLHELKAYINYIQIPVTMEQQFRKGKSIMPSISAGVVAYRPLQERFVYEYIDGSGEYKLRATYKDNDFSVDNLRLGAGATFKLNNHFSFYTKMIYQHSFSQNNEVYNQLKMWALNLGAQYHLQ